MSESERLQRFKDNKSSYLCREEDPNYAENEDRILAKRIRAFLNHPGIEEYSMVDAYYYDFSVIPRLLQGRFCGDIYFLYGITEQGEIITKWVKRGDLDSDDEVVNGEVKNERP